MNIPLVHGLKPLVLIGPFLLLSSLAPAESFWSPSDNPEENRSTNCDNLLTPTQLGREFELWDINPLSNEYGLLLTRKGSAADNPTVVVNLPSLIFARSYWRHEWWETAAERYSFLDIGFKNLEQDSYAINEIIAQHLLKGSKHNLKFVFGHQRAKDLDLLVRLRRTVHKLVIETYQNRKPYLDKLDLVQLLEVNRGSSNSDVFALVDNDPNMKWEDLTRDEIRKRLVMTMQINYFGEHQFLFPSKKGVVNTQDKKVILNGNSLPFEYRLSSAQLDDFRRALYQRFDAQTSCELTRWAKVGGPSGEKLSSEFMDRFLAEVLMTVRERGMNTIFVSADKATRRIFSRYQFKLYSPLPIMGEAKSDEVLMYLDLASSEAYKLYEKLSVNARMVKTQRVYHE